ncbi:MAG TPA: hypothetical protein PKY30_00010 [Myxococcota bacterium]|nr:hypothetical protein [Myxococcota bacterium]
MWGARLGSFLPSFFFFVACTTIPEKAGESPSKLESLHPSSLRPAVGEKLWIEAVWSGAWPPKEDWSDATEVAPGLAWWQPTRAGPRGLSLSGQSLTLEVQALPVDPPLPLPLRVEPLPALRSRCPVGLAGAWVYWCTGSTVDRIMNLEGREVLTIQGPKEPAAAAGLLYRPGMGLWRLPAPEAEAGTLVIGAERWATDGQDVVVSWPDRVELFALAGGVRTRTSARPLPQQPLAVGDGEGLWVERDGATGEDIWYRDKRADAHPLARREIAQRLPVADGRWRGWAEPDHAILDDRISGERRRYPSLAIAQKIESNATSIGFLSNLSLWQQVLCWEERVPKAEGVDIDLRCSDGLHLDRPGNQRAPSRFGPWLLFEEAGGIFLATLQEWPIDDEDPGVEGGQRLPGGYRGSHRDGPVRYAVDWPATGWSWERWEAGAWQRVGPLVPGPQQLDAPAGDAIRLVPGI